jgi:glutamate carboxypeptidase
MQTYSQDYLPKLQGYQPEIVQRLALLVNIDSGSGHTAGINLIMAYLEQWLSAAGFSVTLHDAGAPGRNLVARFRGRGALRLLLVGHVDTVYHAGSAVAQPFEIREGLAYGPGVIDMKSGVLMGIYALRVLLESGFDDFGEIIVVFNNDEEVGSGDSAPLLQTLAREADIGLVLEGSRSPEILTHARKGADRYTLEVDGIPAHSGAEPFKGRSAVIELAHKMIAIHNLNTLFPGVTFNVTRISSSELFNIVPDFARCFISVRSFTQQGLDMAAEALQKIAAACSVPDTTARLLRARGRRPYQGNARILSMVEMAKIEGQALGLTIKHEGKGGLSDANLLMEVGLATLDSLGPTGGGMHDLQREYLRLDSIPLRGALLAGLLQRLCLSEYTGD